MKIYKVHLDLSMVIGRLRQFQLKEYNSEFPIVFVEAKSPDDACFKSVYILIQGILRQDSSIETRLLCRNLKDDIRIIKASCQ